MTTLAKAGLNVRVSPDGCQAHLIVHQPEGSERMTREEILAVLAEAGVRVGIKEDVIESVASGLYEGGSVLVAEGTKPVAGSDGWVEFLVESATGVPGEEEGAAGSAQPSEKRIDLHELHFIQNVLKGQALARIHPPGAGTPGIAVNGQPIPARIGKNAAVHLGPHVAVAGDDRLSVVAAEDGNAILSHQHGIEVKPVITLPGNVDFSTGNIDFVGSLVVTGDIKSDFTVKVRRSLQVLGNVEDAIVEAGEDVTVKKGFVGRGKGTITAGRNVSVHHVLNQSIVAGEEIAVEKETVNGSLRAGRRINAPRAVVAGGSLEADQEIVVATLGNSDGVQAKIRVGRRGKILERIGQLDKEIKHVEKQYADVKDAVYRLIKLKLDAGVLCEEKEGSLKKLQEAQKLLPARITALQDEKTRLNSELQDNVDARLTVHESVYENVLIEINGEKRLMDQAVKDVTFFERNGKVEIQACEEKPRKTGNLPPAQKAKRP